MPATVEDTYPEIWHYTTAEGLHGILTSQVLQATNIFYLNDDEEFKGFFDRKLFDLLLLGVTKGVRHALISPRKRKHIESHGGAKVFAENMAKTLHMSIRSVSHQMEAFVASFCVPSGKNISDGLLSQWRGYGRDGGYAIVFDTQGLKSLLEGELSKYLYSFSNWGDVDYFDTDTDSEQYEEAEEWGKAISASAEDLVFELDEEKFKTKAEKLFNPVLALATRHKHGGFSEEKEVRITMIPVREEEILQQAEQELGSKNQKEILYRVRNGMLVPFISLFESKDSNMSKLPITKIIIGPHPDNQKRKRSIESMLRQLKISADVVISEIPYLGS